MEVVTAEIELKIKPIITPASPPLLPEIAPRHCCVCGAKESAKAFRKEGSYNLRRCSNCSLVYLVESSIPENFFLDAREDKSLEKEADKKAIYWSFPEMLEKYPQVFRYYFRHRLRRLLKINPNIKSVFDVGAGYGFWMDYCREHGMEVAGIDLSDEAVRFANERLKLPVEKKLIEDIRPDRTYDAITFCDVLEHLEDPNRELQTLKKAMHKNSILYIQVPDVLGFKFPRGYSLLLPHHLWQFNYRSLNGLLERNGLKVVKRWSGTMGIVGYYEHGKINLGLRIVLGIITRLRLGNRLMVACQRMD